MFPGDSFLKKLEAKRAEWTEKKKGGKRKKIDVPPGKSVVVADILCQSGSSSTDPAPKRPRSKKRILNEDGDDDVDDDMTITQEESDDNDEDAIDRQLAIIEQDEQEESQFERLIMGDPEPTLGPVEKEVGKFCVVRYMGSLYPGKILKVDENGADVSSMAKSLKSWKWPSHPDVFYFPWEDVLGGIKAPQQISKRGIYRVVELEGF